MKAYKNIILCFIFEFVCDILFSDGTAARLSKNSIKDWHKFDLEYKAKENQMEIKDILSRCDHTLLIQTATEEDIKLLCDDGIKYGVASVCIPPCYVKAAKEYAKDKLKICTVVGFPNGYSKTETKVFETEAAILDGADEIDMVINIGLLKAKKYDALKADIKAVRTASAGKVLKVIIETCLLTDEEKSLMCSIVADAGADFIKTSTGFSMSGATVHDVDVLKEASPVGLKIKAAGGIMTLLDAEDFIKRGADRLGTSRIVKIVKNDKTKDGY